MAGSHVKAEFPIHDAVVLTGFTKSMLDYLARDKIMRPSGGSSGRGHRRLYTYADVVVLRALHSICEGSGKIRHLRKALAALRKELGPLHPGSRLDRLLFVQGDELCLRAAQDMGRQLRNGQMTLALVVDMKAVATFVAGSVESDPATGLLCLKPKLARQAETVRQEILAPIRAKRSA